MRKTAALLLLIFVFAQQGFSQNTGEDELGAWYMYFGLNKISDKISIHSEIQHRNHEVGFGNIEQLLIRTGLNYHLSDKAFVTAGYAYIPSYQYQSERRLPETEEHRSWQQLIMINNIGRIKFEHRYRVEQRWVNGIYGNRFRYRIMAFIPINNPTIEPGTFFLGLYDEIFIKDQFFFFDRNRLYGALGYQISKAAGIQVGVLRQRVLSFSKNYLQLALVYNPDLRN